MRTLVVVGGVGFKKWENMCRLNCVGVEKSEYYINVGVKKWLKKTAFRCKKVEAKKGYQNKWVFYKRTIKVWNICFLERQINDFIAVCPKTKTKN